MSWASDSSSSGSGSGFSVGSSTFSDLGGAVSDLFSAEATGYKQEALSFEAENYDAAATLAQQNEQITKTSTAIKQQQSDRELYMSLGKTQAAVGGAGLAESGNSLDLLRTSAQQGATQRAVLGQQGLIQEAGYQEQAASYQNMASAAEVAIKAEGEAKTGDYIGAGLKAAGAAASLAAL